MPRSRCSHLVSSLRSQPCWRSQVAYATLSSTAANAAPSNNPYFIKLKHKTGVHADIEAVFAGKLHLANNSFFDRLMIKLIFKMSGEQIGDSEIEFTDWDQVDRIADAFQQL